MEIKVVERCGQMPNTKAEVPALQLAGNLVLLIFIPTI
jgi:hypothetical protein